MVAPSAAATASAEARRWASVAEEWTAARHPQVWADRPAREVDVVRFHDPRPDLERRARTWGFEIGDADVSDLARFAAALAQTEAEAWEADEPQVATRAVDDRRFLIGDRLLHWAVPWLDAVGRCYIEERATAHGARDVLLQAGDMLRPVPDHAGGEGVYLPGHDAYGPIATDRPLQTLLTSLWSGALLLTRTIYTLTGGAGTLDEVMSTARGRADLAELYHITGARWRRMAQDHPGTAGLWRDLAARAGRTAQLVAAARS